MKIDSITKFLQNDDLVKNMKTIGTIVLAFIIAVATQGDIFDEFSTNVFFERTLYLSTLGLYFSISLVTNEFAKRAYHDQVDSNEELQEARATIKANSKKFDSTKANQILKQYNKERIEELREDSAQEAKDKLRDRALELQNKVDELSLKGFRYWQVLKKRKVRKLNKKINKLRTKADRIDPKTLYVEYDYIYLNDLKTADNDASGIKSEKKKFNDDPAKRTRKRMAIGNGVKLFVFIGLQGAIFASVRSWGEFLFYLLVVVFSLSTTALTAYEMTRRYTKDTHVINLYDKIERQEYVLEKQKSQIEHKLERKVDTIPAPRKYKLIGGTT